METLKIQFIRSRINISHFLNAFLLIAALFFLSVVVTEFGKDVEEFDWHDASLGLINVILFYWISFRLWISERRILNKYGTKEELTAEIPVSKIQGVKFGRFEAAILAAGTYYYIRLNGLKNNEEIVKLSQSLPLKYSRGCKILRGLAFGLFAIFFISALINPFYKFDLKFLLPLEQIEVVEVDGVLNRDSKIRFGESEKDRGIYFIIEGVNPVLNYQASHFLSNKFVNENRSNILPTGTICKFKIRKDDLEQFRTAEVKNNFEIIRCYGLSVNEELILQKKGLKNVPIDF